MFGYARFPQQLFRRRRPGLDDLLAALNQSFEHGQVIGSTMNLPPSDFCNDSGVGSGPCVAAK